MAVDLGWDWESPEAWAWLMDKMVAYHKRTGRPYKMPPGWLQWRERHG